MDWKKRLWKWLNTPLQMSRPQSRPWMVIAVCHAGMVYFYLETGGPIWQSLLLGYLAIPVVLFAALMAGRIEEDKAKLKEEKKRQDTERKEHGQ